ncbi:MAG: hypothetical protein QM765_16860 [Myxococcales bacterium]
MTVSRIFWLPVISNPLEVDLVALLHVEGQVDHLLVGVDGGLWGDSRVGIAGVVIDVGDGPEVVLQPGAVEALALGHRELPGQVLLSADQIAREVNPADGVLLALGGVAERLLLELRAIGTGRGRRRKGPLAAEVAGDAGFRNGR